MHNLSADIVIQPFGIPRTAKRSPFQVSFRRLTAALLQTGAEGAKFAAIGFDRCPAVLPPFTIRGKFNDAHVNAENTVRHIGGRGFFHVAGGVEEPNATKTAQVSLSLLGGKQGALTVATDEGNRHSSLHRPYGYARLRHLPAQDTVIVGDCARWLKNALRRLIEFIGVGDFSVATNNDLRGEGKNLPNGFVRRFVKVVLLEGVVVPRPLANSVASGISDTKRFFKGFGLFRRYNQLHLRGQLHAWIVSRLSSIETEGGFVPFGKGKRVFLPTHKCEGLQLADTR